MNYEIINLTDNEHNLITEMLNSIEQIENTLSSMTRSERIAWFRSKRFPHKIDFEKEISGTGCWVLRGKNREKAKLLGNDGRYLKLAVLATSIFKLSHWRNDVTIASYLNT